jgi:hypothetical protein
MSIDFDLYDEVISDFVETYVFTRYAVTTNTIGREERVGTPSDVVCYIHPNDNERTTDVPQEGYHYEQTVKIFALVNVDIKKDDEVLYQGQNYRVLENNIKVVGDYSKFIAGLIA